MGYKILLIAISSLGVGIFVGVSYQKQSQRLSSGDLLFLRSYGIYLHEGVTVDQRLRAIKEIVQNPEHESWAVLLLLDTPMDYKKSKDELLMSIYQDDLELYQQVLEDHKRFEAWHVAMLVRAIESIQRPSFPLLFSITCYLNDFRQGEYSETVSEYFGLVLIHKDFIQTKPLNEVARETLVKFLGVDHEYDVAKWRDEIIYSFLQLKNKPKPSTFSAENLRGQTPF